MLLNKGLCPRHAPLVEAALPSANISTHVHKPTCCSHGTLQPVAFSLALSVDRACSALLQGPQRSQQHGYGTVCGALWPPSGLTHNSPLAQQYESSHGPQTLQYTRLDSSKPARTDLQTDSIYKGVCISV